MTRHRWVRYVQGGVALAYLFAAGSHAAEFLGGDLNITGFIRGNVAYSLKHDNPSNRALQGLGYDAKDDQDLNLARLFLVTDFDYQPKSLRGGMFDSVRLFARARVNYDFTQDVSGGLSNYDAFTLDFKHDSSLMRAHSDTVAAELWEAFVDLKKGPTWLRLGRQNIVWGEADALRLLDVVNALDGTQQFFAGEGELFDHRRIPVWAARMTYQIKALPGNSVDAFVIPGDYVPTPSADIGSPTRVSPIANAPGFCAVAVSPCPVDATVPGLLLTDEVDKRRGDWEGGIRWLGAIGGLQYTLNYISKIDQDGVTVFNGIVPGFNPSSGDIIRANLLTKRERLDIFGASFNWFHPALGAVWRGEITYTPNQRYGNITPIGSTALRKNETTRWVIGFDRPTFIFPTEQAMSISVQWFQTIRADGTFLDLTAAPLDKKETNFSILVSQPVIHNQLFYEFLGIIDTDDAYLWQPQLRYQPGDHWRFALYANLYSGSETRPLRLGGLKFNDEVNLSVTYQF